MVKLTYVRKNNSLTNITVNINNNIFADNFSKSGNRVELKFFLLLVQNTRRPKSGPKSVLWFRIVMLAALVCTSN